MHLLLITALFLLLATPLTADIGRIPERLTYDLSWNTCGVRIDFLLFAARKAER